MSFDGLVEAFVVEPVDPVEGFDLDVFDVAPGSFGADQLGLVGPIWDSAKALS